MRRSVLLLLVGAIAALGLWYAFRARSPKLTSSPVTSLLPRETLALVHLPDFSSSRARLHESDLYKLWREPAVQDFLQKPLAGSESSAQAQQKMAQLEELGMKDAFFAITSWENKELTMLGGFRFKGSPENAEKTIGGWRNRLGSVAAEPQRTTLTYERHPIEVLTQGSLTLATVYDGEWFFAANNIDALKALLDRADKRATDAATTLSAEENYAAALRHMPASYAIMAFARVDRYLEQLLGKLPPDSANAEQFAGLRKIRSVSGASTFENGKIRDVLFVAMPKLEQMPELQRGSLTLGTKDTFLYLANVLALSNGSNLQSVAGLGPGLPGALPALVSTFTDKGVSLENWNAAFQPEISVLGDWPEGSRTPGLFLSLPVKDAAQAQAIATAITSASGDTAWTASTRDGVQYFSKPPSNPMMPVAPTAGLNGQWLVLGLDLPSVEAVMQRSAAAGTEFRDVQNYQTAVAQVPAPTQMFAYVDSAMLYTRLDAAVRPMLVMAAAFMPAIAQTVDLGKLPAADVIARHLSPLVIAQSYQTDGYLTSSIGPISVYQAVLGAAVVSGAGARFYQGQIQRDDNPALDTAPDPQPTPDAEESPSPNP